MQDAKIIEGLTGQRHALQVAWLAHVASIWTGAQCFASRLGRPMVQNLVTHAMIGLGSLPEEG